MRGYVIIDNSLITLEVESFESIGNTPFALCKTESGVVCKIDGNTKKIQVNEILTTCFYRNKFQAKNSGWTGKIVYNHRQGEWVKYYPDGIEEIKGKYIDDQKYGEWIYYYPNGKIKSIGIYNCDEKEGIWTYYTTEGNLQKTVNYHRDVPC